MEITTLILFLIVAGAALYFWHRAEMLKTNQKMRTMRTRFNRSLNAGNERITKLEESLKDLSSKSPGDRDDPKILPKAKNPAEAMEDRYAEQMATTVSVNGRTVRTSN